MIDVWDILCEILIDLGLEKKKWICDTPGWFRLVISFNDKYISVISKHDKYFAIDYMGHNKIRISRALATPSQLDDSAYTYIDLCDPDCITKIKENVCD